MQKYLSAFIVLFGVINVVSLNEQVVIESNGNFINEEPEPSSRFLSDHHTLSVSKEWALQFDEQLGRGDFMTEEKQMEIHNNLLEAAEILHIIPPGSKSKYSNFAWELEGISEPTQMTTTAIPERSHGHGYDHSSLPVSIKDLRHYGVNTFPKVATESSSRRSSQVKERRHEDKGEELQQEEENSRLGKYSPRLRLAVYARRHGRKIAKKQSWNLR